ncbi:uncharacterized protein PFL1_04076 [Pseudozyma flocculosa PF-1]|uniref:Uncharacterized protein n=1 Tax=Pseudozyma flocculosa PF-1 TaxID=1277687 RepID=A0A061H706_9BASI|nr:uncharacterized protein PFL1_04076 [Pseudozyma flocculosa PF-1]EPQ28249.1 hypothetical protein PFL1_04076 [Pseudozyma flocculosa PF-1]
MAQASLLGLTRPSPWLPSVPSRSRGHAPLTTATVLLTMMISMLLRLPRRPLTQPRACIPSERRAGGSCKPPPATMLRRAVGGNRDSYCPAILPLPVYAAARPTAAVRCFTMHALQRLLLVPLRTSSSS